VAAPREEKRANRGSEERRSRMFELVAFASAALAALLFAAYEMGAPGRTPDATSNVTSFFLVNLNVVLLLVVIFMVARNVTKVVVERRRGVLGSHLRSRLVFAFFAVAFFPGALMVVFSYGFATDSIDDWLSDDIEEALDGAWDVAHRYYRDIADSSVAHAQALAATMAREGAPEDLSSAELRALILPHQRAYGLGAVHVVDPRGLALIAVGGEGAATGLSRLPGTELFTRALAGQADSEVESVGDGDVIRGAAPIRAADGSVVAVVVVDAWVEQSAKRAAENIVETFGEFRKLRLGKRPLKNLYLLTVGLAALVVVLGASWLGIVMARTITDPIGRLAAATRDVASGRWDLKLDEETGDDEVGTLTQAFRSMASDLRRTHEDLESRRAYTENVLANVDAGVVSVDRDGRIGTINPAARELLGIVAEDAAGAVASEVFARAELPAVARLLEELRAGKVNSGAQITVVRERAGLTMLVTATRLDVPGTGTVGSVLFFENVSGIVEVQRMEAWREVARRIAHEIKNPLTPIQLSAQRLGRRLQAALAGEDAALLEECVGTIVREVEGLKNLVNEFSRFARTSTAERTPQDLGELVGDTLSLYRQSRPDIQWDLHSDAGLPAVPIERDGVRRALVNLLDNAVAAVSAEGGTGGLPPAIGVSVVGDRHLRRVVLAVADNGPGIPEAQRSRVFEPYFSTKEGGTGLGLALVSSMAADHHAYVRIVDHKPRGTRILIEFPTIVEEAAERT
jgi:two-component system nitrogen regulation sensor histidine kinase NtrY